MKRDNFYENEDNEISNKSTVFQNIKTNKEGVPANTNITFQKMNFKPLLNPYTFEKDIKILDLYANPFLNFFYQDSTPTLPMFTYPPTPKSVKRVTLDRSFVIEANKTGYFQFFPFTKCVEFATDGPSIQKFYPEAPFDCFSSYKVVCCKIMLKQVGIMHLSDGYGTVFDAIVTGAQNSFNYLKENLLNVQVQPGKKLMMVDGRQGLTAMMIGSPLYDEIYRSSVMMKPSVYFGINNQSNEVYIPPNSRIANFVNVDNPSYLGLAPTTSDAVLNQISPNTAWMAALPQGECLFVRVSPPTINISIKIYVDMVVEGIVRDEYLSNMPQYSPTIPFDFNRIILAFNNVLPSLKVCPQISACCQKLPKDQKIKIIYPTNPKKGKVKALRIFDHDKLFIKNSDFKIEKKKPQNYKKSLRNFKEKIEHKRMIDLKYQDFLNYAQKINIFEPREAPSPKRSLRLYKEEFDMYNPHFDPQIYREPSLEYIFKPIYIPKEKLLSYKRKEKPRDLRKKPIISYCMNNKPKEIDIKNLSSIRKTYNVVKEAVLPDYVREACDFSGELVTLKKMSELTNRLYRDSITPMPFVSYAFFPAITEKEVYPAIAVCKLGIYGDTTVTFKVPPLDGKEKLSLKVSYFKDQFVEPDEFYNALNTIILYAYGKNYHYCPDEGFTIKLFGKGKFKDISYMAAVLAVIYGGPSGGFYTGSFTYDEESDEFQANKMEDEVLQKKETIASQDYPLFALGEDMDEGAATNVISGSFPSYDDGKCIPSSNVDNSTIYFLSPFSVRAYKKTPIDNLTADCKQYILKKVNSPLIKYIIYSNVDSLSLLESINKKGITYKAFTRANPDNYTNYIVRAGKIISADEFYSEHSDLLEQGAKFWFFDFNNHIFAEKNTFVADVRMLKYNTGLPSTEENLKKAQLINKDPSKINNKDVELIKERKFESLTNGTGRRNKIEISDLKKGNTRKLTVQEMKGADKMLKEVKRILRHFAKFVYENPPSSSDYQRITTNSGITSILGILGFSTNVSGNVDLSKNPSYLNFMKMVKCLGTGGVVVAANLCGWFENPDTNYPTDTLNKLYSGLQDLGKEKLEDMGEDDEKTEEIRKNMESNRISAKKAVEKAKSKKKKKKPTNKGLNKREAENEKLSKFQVKKKKKIEYSDNEEESSEEEDEKEESEKGDEEDDDEKRINAFYDAQ